MMAPTLTGSAEHRVLRRVSAVAPTAHGVELEVEALPAVQVGSMPGWLTGEPLAEQGIETTLPNLPVLDLPDTNPVTLRLRVEVVAPGTVRLVLAPPGHRLDSDDGTGLGIVVEPRPDPPEVRVSVEDDAVTVTAPGVAVRIGRAPFGITVTEPDSGAVALRTAGHLRQAAGLAMAPAVLLGPDGMTLHCELGSDERITGFGEQFSPLVKNGQRLVLRSEDALGTGTGLAYKPVPVWQSSAGVTGMLNTGARTVADVGHSRPAVLGLTVADDGLDLYLVLAPTLAGRLTGLTALSGRAPVPPVWAFGYWMGRCRYHSAREMLDVGRGMREHQVPCDVLHVDPDWLVVDRLSCDFIWNTERFGNRKGFVDDLAELGLRLSVWELPYLDPASPAHAEAEAAGYLVRRTDGTLATIEKTPTPDGRPRALIDFTNPAAKQWWQDRHRDFLADGVAVFKTDFGEALPDDVALHDGTPAQHAHNLYPLRYNATVSEVIADATGRNPLVWGRSGWAGSQRYPGQWGGDAESTVAGMRATVRGGLSYAVSAPGFWSHDIGGFFGPDLTPGLYVRWTQLGALSPLMRAHGLRPREPWALGEEALQVARSWIRLRYSLLPYLWQVAQQAAEQGWPVIRPVDFHSADRLEAGAGLDGQLMLGDDLLVVPIFDDGAAPVQRRYFVPEGGWTDLVTGRRHTGPGWTGQEVALAEMPVLVRDGAVLPRVEVDADVRGTEDLLQQRWTLHAYGPAPRTVRLTDFSSVVHTVDLTAEHPLVAAVLQHG